MEVICDMCLGQLKELGALYFSPPKDGKVTKKHICVDCDSKLGTLTEIKRDKGGTMCHLGDIKDIEYEKRAKNICDTAPYPECNGADGCDTCEHQEEE